MPLLLTDADVAARLDARTAVAAMRDALVAAHEGRLIAPPRASAVLEGGRLVMTAGHLADEWYGFRSYDTFGHATASSSWCCTTPGTGGSGRSRSARRSGPGAPARSAVRPSTCWPGRTPPPSG